MNRKPIPVVLFVLIVVGPALAGACGPARAKWRALMAALMNIALQRSGLATKYLGGFFVVERGDYDNLGRPMTTAVAISLILSLLALGLVSRRIKLGAAAGPAEPKPWKKI